MTKRIFLTLKSRLPEGARAESRESIDALADALATFRKGASAIDADARFTPAGKLERLAELKKSTMTAGPLADLRSNYARRLEALKGEQSSMRARALGRNEDDPVAALRQEVRDGEIRALVRSLPVHERLAAVQADPAVAKAVIGAPPLLSGLPPDVHATLLDDLTSKAVAERFGDRAAQIGDDISELEHVVSATQLACDLVEREGSVN